jgi:hypothetical protein
MILVEIQIILILQFSKFTSGWLINLLWPALALIFSPFGIKHQNGITVGPLTPLPHQNVKLKRRGNENTKKELRTRYILPECSGSSFLVQVHFPFQCSFETFKCTQTNMLVSKESSCSTSPPKHMHYLHRDL